MSSPSDCCSPCNTVVSVGPPGPSGNDGLPGADGAPGVNAYTLTTSDFTRPADSADVTVNVLNSEWMAIGQVIVVDGPAHFRVASKPSGTSAILTAQGYTGDVAQGTNIPAGSTVSPAGPQGP